MRSAQVLASFVVLVGCGKAAPGPGDGGQDAGPIDAGGSEDGGTEEDAGPTLPAEEREVRIPAAGLTLDGTLHLPERRAAEARPGVVLVHGSGPNSRDERADGQLGIGFLTPVYVFTEIAEALAAAGYVVVRYDKRSCGPFNGCADNGYPEIEMEGHTIYDYVDDAEAVLTFLGGLDEVDPERLVFVGHSEGATYAPRVLAERSDVVAGVMLAGPHRGIDAIWAYQIDFLRDLLREAGASEEYIDAELASSDETTRDLQALRAGTHDGSAIEGIPAAYWESWMELGDAAPVTARTVTQPLLALGGLYDWNVPASEVDLWIETFGAATGNHDHLGVVLPCITHALNCISEPDPQRIGPEDIGAGVDASVLTEVITFLDDHTGR